ncbi:MAG: hypothetical protein RL637_1299 [Pseudomonadota bacterium]
MNLKSLIIYSLFGLTIGTLNGCSWWTLWNNSAQLTDYGEKIFRRQNELTNQFMLLEEQSISNIEWLQLQQAEQQMRQACQLLNDYASREMDHQTTNLWSRKQLTDSLPICQQKIQQLESLFQQLHLSIQ